MPPYVDSSMMPTVQATRSSHSEEERISPPASTGRRQCGMGLSSNTAPHHASIYRGIAPLLGGSAGGRLADGVITLAQDPGPVRHHGARLGGVLHRIGPAHGPRVACLAAVHDAADELVGL